MQTIQVGSILHLYLLRSFLCDPRCRLSDLLAPGFLLQLRGPLHLLAGAVCEGFGPFAFLAGFLTCSQFAFRHESRLSYARSLGYPPVVCRLSEASRPLTSLTPKTRLEGERATSFPLFQVS